MLRAALLLLLLLRKKKKGGLRKFRACALQACRAVMLAPAKLWLLLAALLVALPWTTTAANILGTHLHNSRPAVTLPLSLLITDQWATPQAWPS